MTAAGAEVSHVWPSKGEVRPLYADFGKPLPIWCAGVIEEVVEIAPGSSLETIAHQMLGIG